MNGARNPRVSRLMERKIKEAVFEELAHGIRQAEKRNTQLEVICCALRRFTSDLRFACMLPRAEQKRLKAIVALLEHGQHRIGFSLSEASECLVSVQEIALGHKTGSESKRQ